jgi:penicillin-binding protein 1C
MRAKRPPSDVVAGVVAALAAFAFVAALNVSVSFLASADGARAIAAVQAVDTSRRVVDREGRLLRAFAIDDGRWRLPVALENLDPRLVDMLLAYEDSRFASHPGVDPLALLRAAWQLAVNGRIVSGGSTITMQLARLLDPGARRTMGAKLAQIRDALRLERSYDKQEILELYLTLAPYGGNLEGIRAASLAWFGKEPRRLTLDEAALLVALPQAPEVRRPDRHPDAARRARDRVIDRMLHAGVVDGAEAARARAAAVPTGRLALPSLAPHLSRRIVQDAPQGGEWRLTVDRTLQQQLEGLAAERAQALGDRISMAILVADFTTGEVLAEVGSAGYFDDARAGQIDMVHAVRSPGSALKPLIYGLAFEAGLAHPGMLINDRPTSFSGYRPRNFELDYQGTVTVREALQHSLNVPAVRLLDAVGPARLAARLRRAGADPELPRDGRPGLPVGLGGVGVSLDGLVRLFAGLAAGGSPVSLVRATAEAGGPSAREFLDSRAAWLVSDVLSGTQPPAERSAQPIAYKTGTSYGYRDAWAIGYDGRHVVGIWTGRADGAPVPGLTGGTAAAPVLYDAFRRISADRAPLPPAPAGTLVQGDAPLPMALRRFGADRPEIGSAAARPLPVIVFPPDGARVTLGLSEPLPRPLVVKVDGGHPPFRWFVNGSPQERAERRRETSWQPGEAGFSTISVVDAYGRGTSVSVFLE